MFLKQLLNRTLLFAMILTFFVCLTNKVYAQGKVTADSTIIITHSPKKATYFALIPGAGQIYNKKYWKLPIVYAGFAVTGYFAFYARGEYLDYNEAYICKLNGCENQLATHYDTELNADVCSINGMENELAGKYTSEQLKSARDYYRRNMELSFIFMGAWYILQILDATVDAHLYYWEVNENLSVRVEPTFQRSTAQMPPIIPNNNINHNGLKITVSF